MDVFTLNGIRNSVTKTISVFVIRYS